MSSECKICGDEQCMCVWTPDYYAGLDAERSDIVTWLRRLPFNDLEADGYGLDIANAVERGEHTK